VRSHTGRVVQVLLPSMAEIAVPTGHRWKR
jgi:hypothetical protein